MQCHRQLWDEARLGGTMIEGLASLYASRAPE